MAGLVKCEFQLCLLAAFSLGADVPTSLRKGALEALGGLSGVPRNVLTLRYSGVFPKTLCPEGMGDNVLSVVSNPLGFAFSMGRFALFYWQFEWDETSRSFQWRFALLLWGRRFAPVGSSQNFSSIQSRSMWMERPRVCCSSVMFAGLFIRRAP